VLMPGFAKELSDTQIATLGTYLIQHFGNPAAKVSVGQVASVRSRRTSTTLVILAQATMTVGALVVIGLVAWLLLRRKKIPT
jgi:hypothetical protein